MDEDNNVAEQQQQEDDCEEGEEDENEPNYENTDTVANNTENNLSHDDDDDDDDDDDGDNEVTNPSENNAEECYDDDDVEENFEGEKGENFEQDENGMSDKLFSKVLSELITLKSRTELKKKQSKVIPCAKNFLNLNISERSRKMTKNVRKNVLHICDFVHRGKFPIDISNDNLRFLRHLLDKRTPKEDVDVGLTEDLRTHQIMMKLIEKDGDGTRKKPRTC
jgi:hypothetical protein